MAMAEMGNKADKSLVFDLKKEIPVENNKEDEAEAKISKEVEIDGENDTETSDDSGYEGDVKVGFRELSFQDQVFFLSRRVDDLENGQSSRSRKYLRLQQLLSSETSRLQNHIDGLQIQMQESASITEVLRGQLEGILNRLTHLERLGASRESDFTELDNILEMIVGKVLRMERESRLSRAQNIPLAPVPAPVSAPAPLFASAPVPAAAPFFASPPVPVSAPFFPSAPVSAPFFASPPVPVPTQFFASAPVPVPPPVPAPAPAAQHPAAPNQNENHRRINSSETRKQCLWCQKTLSASYITKHMKTFCKQKPLSEVRVRNHNYPQRTQFV